MNLYKPLVQVLREMQEPATVKARFRHAYLSTLAWVRSKAEAEIRRVIGADRRCPVCETRPCFDHCYECRVDCTEADHLPSCSYAGGLCPVTEADVYLRGGMRCGRCSDLLRVGDATVGVPCSEGSDVLLAVCMACAALPH